MFCLQVEERLTQLEGELQTANDNITQLKHDLQLKTELLHIYNNDFDESGSEAGQCRCSGLGDAVVFGVEQGAGGVLGADVLGLQFWKSWLTVECRALDRASACERLLRSPRSIRAVVFPR